MPCLIETPTWPRSSFKLSGRIGFFSIPLFISSMSSIMELTSLGLLGHLPAELRNKIYYMALCETQGDVWIEHRVHAGHICFTPKPALTQASRTIREEPLGIYFSSNNFTVRTDFTGQDLLSYWVENIVTPRYYSCLRHVLVWRPLCPADDRPSDLNKGHIIRKNLQPSCFKRTTWWRETAGRSLFMKGFWICYISGQL